MAASPAVVSVATVPRAAAPAFARCERLDAHFNALAQGPATEAVLRHLLVHVEAALHPLDRVALYDALAAVVRALDAQVLHAATALFDGRFRALLRWLGAAGGAVEEIAWAHLEGADNRVFCPDAAFVLRWLDRHGAATPSLQLAAIRARVAGQGWGALAQDQQVLAEQQLCLALAQDGGALAAPALCIAFELAVVAGSEQAALGLLATCVQAGAHAGLRPALLRAWLEADGAGLPLALQAPLQVQWLRPSALHQPAYRAALIASLQRPAVRSRCVVLDALLPQPATPVQPEARAAWRALAQLDGVYAAADAGEPVAAAAAALLGGTTLAPAAVAALQRRCALEAIDQGDPHAAGVALAAARAAIGDAQDAAVLQQLLLAIDEAVVRAAAASAGLPQDAAWTATRWQDEAPLWRALAEGAHEHLRPMAAYQLARLYTDGSWVPCTTHKTQQLQAAQALWTELAGHPAYAALAQRRLASPSWQLMVQAEVRDAGRPHLWVPCADPAARRLLIVFSCVDSHHGYTQVNALARQMQDHHLLFINNPELNWYSDAVFDDVAALIEARVLPRFAREDVSCYFGSMGGHAALKFALHFGFQALVFNPQVDLALWAAFRPQQRALLLAAQAHADVQQAAVAQFEQSPVCYFVGSSIADREAFSLWLAQVRTCRHGSFIVEKRPDPHHAGLIARVAPRGGTVPLLQRSLERLRELRAVDVPHSHAEVPAALLPRWWQQLDHAAALKVEILIREGRVYLADSNAIGSLPLA
ncbi:hypothetical protein [Ideonella sp. BN130291]|uniref:hypothetical protein n=1 Tax=Ideonella sp. BN130291 TaxID=3112940 RepID=UPI002E259066|nr:hypothetical protein [Ideonella sp. BN130291]